MKATFIVNLDIDEGVIHLDAKRSHRSPEGVLADLLGDCECRLVDAVRWRDGVARIGSELLVEPEAVRQ